MNKEEHVKVTENFYLDEFWDKRTYIMNNKATLIEHLDMDFINDIQKLRSNVGIPLTINNWWHGGRFQWRGNRNPQCKEYRARSMHSFVFINGEKQKAYDIVCNKGGQYLQEHVLIHYREYPSFKRMEIGPNWMHIDIKEVPGYNYSMGIYTFKP